MAQTALKRWTVEEFFAWQERQPERFEFVGGLPLRMMAGARNSHDDIAVNLLVALGNRLRGRGCRPFTGDGAVETFPGQIRRPDAGVDCGHRDPNGYVAAAPRMVAEVLSPSTRDFDTIEKLAEYQAVESLDHIVMIEPNAPEVVLWTRASDRTWAKTRIEGLEEAIPLPAIGISLPLAEIFEGVAFPGGARFPG